MSISTVALFTSGLFFGGAVDHAILAAMRKDVTPYGIRSGVAGNWLLAGADLVVSGILFGVHISAERKTRNGDMYYVRRNTELRAEGR